jgi:hypothetical protein
MGREKKEKEEYRQCNISLHCQPITIMFSVISPHLISLYCYNIEGWSILIDYQCKVNLRPCMSFKLEKRFSNIIHLLAGLCNSNRAFFAQVSIFFIFNGFCSYFPYFLLILLIIWTHHARVAGEQNRNSERCDSPTPTAHHTTGDGARPSVPRIGMNVRFCYMRILLFLLFIWGFFLILSEWMMCI